MSSSAQATTGAHQQHVVIVGAGMAGLSCARELLQSGNMMKITILEADSVAGGRVRSSAASSFYKLDLGAEYVHGTGTVLTDLIDELRSEQNWNNEQPLLFYEPIFITSHADGGPDDAPTEIGGKYGMYYVDGELKMYDDPSIQKLSNVLEEIIQGTTDDDKNKYESLGAALDDSDLSPSLRKLAVASYANTAGCSDLHQLSLPMIRQFEKHWEENEVAGDYRLPAIVGMKGIVDALVDKLRQDPRFDLVFNCMVTGIRQPESEDYHVELITSSTTTHHNKKEVVQADAVVVTVPPPLLRQIDFIPPMPAEKLQALDYVGFERIVKVFCKFSQRVWPQENLQSVVVVTDDDDNDDLLIPEVWFREIKENNGESDQTYYIMVGYLTAKAADDFMDAVKRQQTTTIEEAAAELSIRQLAWVLSVSESKLKHAFVDALVYDWKDDHPTVQGGYMYPATGMTVHHLKALAAPIGGGRILFAGEATNTNACCTVQAAMETGIRAAREAVHCLLLLDDDDDDKQQGKERGCEKRRTQHGVEGE